jgi:hypothetical protein
MIMKHIALIMIFLTFRVLASPEDAVLRDGESVTIKNGTGELLVQANKDFKRSFTWNGKTRSVTMLERSEEWLGSKSLYFPGPGEHWAENNGVTRGVIEEGKRDFKDASEFKKWMRNKYQRYLDFRYLGNGRIGGWAIIKDRKQMECVIWEVRLAGVPLSEGKFLSSTEARSK